MAEAVYILCFLTSAAVSVLLLRAYAQRGNAILLWSGLGFIGLSLNNLILVFDAMIVPQIDLSLWRILPALAGMCLLLYGLIWRTQ